MDAGNGERGKGTGRTRRHVILIGLPGSGKTTVGRLVAAGLGGWFVDVDEEIERLERRSVTRIFADQGEAAFRALERSRVDLLLRDQAGVVAPGGGWAAQPGNLDAARGRAYVIYLETSPEKAWQRIARETHRPLLAGAEPREAIRGLYAARRTFYERADATVETDRRTPQEVAAEVIALARAMGGW